MTREQFEAALDAGTLETKIIGKGGDKWYRCRRNGKTKTWKRNPSRFEIPIKFRFRDSMRIHNFYFENGEVDNWFRVAQPHD